jgi:predicted enzyme related to lactoylglutathione lyase
VAGNDPVVVPKPVHILRYRRAVNWVHCILDVPVGAAAATTRFWSAVLGWEIGEPWSKHPEFRSLEPPDGGSFVHVQVIDGPARIHCDLTVGDVEAETHRLVQLGASAGERNEDWQVMTSPGGLPFCLVSEPRHTKVPACVRWPDGHASRLLQVCIDAPEHLHEQETRFWAAATGWALRESDQPEFAGKCYPRDGPIQFLFQQLGPGDKGASTRAHLDLATDDLAAEVERVVAVGATRIGPGRGWYALRDPGGTAFCVTGQSPY